MVERSTVGAAGFNLETPTPNAATTTTATPAQIINWRFLFCFKSGRAISITLDKLHAGCHWNIQDYLLKINNLTD
jgi:hypothetical protein